jgi:hypothetical protein
MLNFFYADPGWKKKSDPGWKKFGSGINIPDPQHCFLSLFRHNLPNTEAIKKTAPEKFYKNVSKD